MCDTFVVTGAASLTGNTILAKNSDREPNEAQNILYLPRQEQKESKVKVTYTTLPQVKETNAVILSQPFWMWGAEMGTNEHGLAIGNEAVFTKIPFPKTNTGLTGMDCIRLALERTSTAENALELITDLIEKYGQDACGGYKDKNFFYHNSFLIADPNEAWLLETADRHWVARQVRGYEAISNGLTIGEEFDLHSKGILDYALQHRMLGKGETFNFRKCFSDWFYTKMSACRSRRESNVQNLKESFSSVDTQEAARILRSHPKSDFTPENSGMNSVCLHASGIATPSQTTSSMISELRSEGSSTVWLTGTSSPCLSIFKPFYFPATSIGRDEFTQAGEFPDESLWWRGERLHRTVLNDYKRLSNVFMREKSRFEQSVFDEERKFGANMETAQASALNQHSKNVLRKSDELLKKWTDMTEDEWKRNPSHSGFSPLYRMYWRKQNQVLSYHK